MQDIEMKKRGAFFSTSDDSHAFYEKLVVGLFKQMRRGHLDLTFPDGRTAEFGAPGPASAGSVHARVRIRSANMFQRCVLYGDVGFGESYEAGEWETDDLTAVIRWAILNIEDNPFLSGSKTRGAAIGLLKWANHAVHALRDNTLQGSRKNISAHYDLGNELFESFLDPSMTYSCADFADERDDLPTAQSKKYDRLCKSLRLNSNDHLLEIGTGWGGFAIHAAREYGCKIKTVTISREQHAFARARVRKEGLENQIEVCLSDYRDITGSFDKIASIEMLEAVGAKHLPTYFAQCHRLLKPRGILGLQVILCADARFEKLRTNVDWTQKYIFPGSLIPSLGAINRAVNKTGDLNLYELHDMGKSYARTLAEWRTRFNSNLSSLRAKGMVDSHFRRWNYYFSYCEAAFESRNITVAQMVYSRPNNPHL